MVNRTGDGAIDQREFLEFFELATNDEDDYTEQRKAKIATAKFKEYLPPWAYRSCLPAFRHCNYPGLAGTPQNFAPLVPPPNKTGITGDACVLGSCSRTAALGSGTTSWTTRSYVTRAGRPISTTAARR
jgi:hypothetical protein